MLEHLRREKRHRIQHNLFPFLIFSGLRLFNSLMHILFVFLYSFNQFLSHAALLLKYTYGSVYTGGPLGLLIIFPEPIFGPPCAASNCDIKRRTIGWTSNTNRIHVQRRSECTILSAFCSVKNSRIVEGKILIYIILVLLAKRPSHSRDARKITYPKNLNHEIIHRIGYTQWKWFANVLLSVRLIWLVAVFRCTSHGDCR